MDCSIKFPDIMAFHIGGHETLLNHGMVLLSIFQLGH